ncbi:MAG: hypothetical protein VB091_03930 [Christensenella sp.]|nr:hypothetical protein [Christensenella sp.]
MLVTGIISMVCTILGLFQWFFDTSKFSLGFKIVILVGLLFITLAFSFIYYSEKISKQLAIFNKCKCRFAIIVAYLLFVIGFITIFLCPKLFDEPKNVPSATPSQVIETPPNITTPSQTDTPAPVSSPVPILPSETVTATSPITPTPFTLIYGKYDEGIGVPDSYTKGMAAYYKYDYGTALHYLLVAAEEGYAPAQYQLGACYHHGTGTKADEEKAFSWYKLSADQYYPNGYLWTGYCYQYGVGVEQDYTIAEAYYLAAQEAGHPSADNRLGDLYLVMKK